MFSSPCLEVSYKQDAITSLSFFVIFILIANTASSNNEDGIIPFNLVAVFSEDESQSMTRILRKVTSDVDSALVDKEVTLIAFAFAAPKDKGRLVDSLCNLLNRRKPHVLLSFVEGAAAFYVSLIASYARIPVIAYSQRYLDRAAKDVNPLYSSLDPSAIDLADAIYQLLKANLWLNLIIIRDDSTFSKIFSRRVIISLSSDPLHHTDNLHRTTELEVRSHDTDNHIRNTISDMLHRVYAKVVLVISDYNTTRRVLSQAGKGNTLEDDRIWIVIEKEIGTMTSPELPIGILVIKMVQHPLDRNVRAAVEIFAQAIKDLKYRAWGSYSKNHTTEMSCWFGPGDNRRKFSTHIFQSVEKSIRDQRQTVPSNSAKTILLPFSFDIYNVLPSVANSILLNKNFSIRPDPVVGMPSTIKFESKSPWRRIGNITSGIVNLDTVLWLMSQRVAPSTLGRQKFRVVTAIAPPFVMATTRVEDRPCLLGVPCLQVSTNSKEDLQRIFADYFSTRSQEGSFYNISCCAGIAIDLMIALARDLSFDVELYLVGDKYFGTRRGGRWNGMTADLISGAAHLVFSAYSMTSSRSEMVDFSVPFYHSSVSCLAYSREKDILLSAFLVPFSFQLWMAIFICLNVTAVCAAIYEWLSPFGLNPWGRMRSKNFSLASALWVMWSLLFSHLVAFKAPKSWPNKVLINLWGCFSVIFVSSYTANIAAHFAGLFFHLRVDDFHDSSLLIQRTGTAKASAAESYIFAENKELWQHIQRYGVDTMEEGLQKLRKSELDVLIGDTSVLNYFRGNEPGCGLHLIGQSIYYDAYAVGMQKNFPLKNAISTFILRYEQHGFGEQMQKKWFGRVPCFAHSVSLLNKPKPLSIGTVAGVFIMLIVGLGVGIVILIIEHVVFKHVLPALRRKPDKCFWKSPHLMFFSQKLYRFINTVELVSPHYSAKEIASNLREGQIFSLFQKSMKRKAKEDARRQKSKSQFFEIIQEIRKIVRTQREQRIFVESPTHRSTRSSKKLRVFPPRPASSTDQRGEGYTFCLHNTSNSHLPSKVARTTEAKRMVRPKMKYPTNKQSLSLQRSQPFALRQHIHNYDYKAPTIRSDLNGRPCPEPRSVPISISLDDLRLNFNEVDVCGRVILHNIRFFSLDDVYIWKKKRKFPHAPFIDYCAYKENGNISIDKMAGPLVMDTDELLLCSLSKNEILTFWRESERHLLNTLQNAINENESLTRKLAFVKRTLINIS